MPIQGSNNKTVSTNTSTSNINNDIRIKDITNTIVNSLSLVSNIPVENYDLDENELSKEGILNKDSIDFSRIATSASNVKNGNFVVIKNTKYWGDTGNLTYKIRDDGTVAIMEDGVILGFTDLNGVNLNNNLQSQKDNNSLDNNTERNNTVEKPNKAEFYDNRINKDKIVINENIKDVSEDKENSFQEVEVLEEQPVFREKAEVEIKNENKVRKALIAAGAEEIGGMLIPKRQFGVVPNEDELSDTDIIENPQIDIHLPKNNIEVYIPQEQLDNVGIVKYAPITVEEKEAYEKAQKLKKDITEICEENGIEIDIMYDWRPRDSGYGTYHATSHHPEGKAIDIIPKDGDFAKLKEFLVTNEDMRKCIDEYGYGVLDESQAGLLENTGGERFHLHIGPDRKGRATWEQWKKEYGVE